MALYVPADTDWPPNGKKEGSAEEMVMYVSRTANTTMMTLLK